MKNLRYVLVLFSLLLIISATSSCVGTASTHEVRLLDSLNTRAYVFRYKDLDSSFQSAYQAYREANLYDQGKAEACNNLGFCAFMRMDFEGAEKLHKKVYSVTQNELELLIADIGLMKIFQRTSMNKEFYDYRNSAIRRMKRIDEDITVFVDAHEKNRLNYARSEFYIVSAIYYYYLQQESEAIAAISSIDEKEWISSDINQYLYYHYIKGSAELFETTNPVEKSVTEFDHLFTAWRTSLQKTSVYFEANSLQGISNMLNEREVFEVISQRRSQALNKLSEVYHFPLQSATVPDTLLPLRLARLALQKFKEYKDIYQIAGTYVSIGKYFNAHERYNEALDSLGKALDYVNFHHQQYYSKKKDSADVLKPYTDQDTIYTELSWIAKKDVKTVPEWISRIREQLSVSYSGLGMKMQSDYNRNIYLDILDYTRQDKELESRYHALETEANQLNVISFFVFISLVLLIIFFWIFSARSRERNRKHTGRLKLTLDVCQKITASIPADVASTDEIICAVTTSILPDLNTLVGATSLRIGLIDKESNEPVFPSDDEQEETGTETIEEKSIESHFDLRVPDKEDPVGVLELYTRRRLSKDDKALMNIIAPYIAWTMDNGLTFISLGDERKRLEKQRYVLEQHIAENKRQNLIKKSCMAIVNGITPYIDRIINEVHKLTDKGYINDEVIKRDKYLYVDELVSKINEYNDILALWIKMKQGSLSLNIENFELNELFELIAKGRKTFEMKHQQLDVEPTLFTVKADKALTLFMINTLTENARKYTPRGGSVKVYAQEGDGYVEISVEDTGMGLSEQDVARIMGEKVYDSSEIGLQITDDAEQLKKSKGNGFGLMNCKGIIEKYRKTNDVFKVCGFYVDSAPGKGSRFYFRLPAGVRKMMGLLVGLLFAFSVASCNSPAGQTKTSTVPTDSTSVPTRNGADQLLNEASLFADTAYYCNVIENYALALQYVDSSMNRLNRHYVKYAHHPVQLMTLKGKGSPAEIEWWNSMFASDYHVILDIRNEAAVSFLALKQWDNYRYNNTAYSSLYKLLGEDFSLEDYCRKLENSTTNKVVGVLLCVLLLVIILIGYYFLYVRKRWVNRLNLEQVLEINKQVFAASLVRVQESAGEGIHEEGNLSNIPQRIVNESFDSINELLTIDRLCLGVFNEETYKLEFAFYPNRQNWLNAVSGMDAEGYDTLTGLMQRCFETEKYTTERLKNTPAYGDEFSESAVRALPLLVDAGGKHQCVGVIALIKQEGTQQETDLLLFELIARYVAIVVFNAVIKLATKYRDIESAHDETRRASWEDSLLHVQNMVLDNCLSTIKHETIYYPNKIKQIIDKLNYQPLPASGEKESVETITELIDYYKGIYTILSSCAARQLEEVTFRRGTVLADDLLTYAQKYFRKVNKGNKNEIALDTEPSGLKVTGDVIQLKFMLENLIDEALSFQENGRLLLQVREDGNFVRFIFTDMRREKTVEELNQLFYPDLARMTAGEGEKLAGTEYLICKQIVRDHDEFAGHRGCRINAEPCAEGGFTVYFTLPRR